MAPAAGWWRPAPLHPHLIRSRWMDRQARLAGKTPEDGEGEHGHKQVTWNRPHGCRLREGPSLIDPWRFRGGKGLIWGYHGSRQQLTLRDDASGHRRQSCSTHHEDPPAPLRRAAVHACPGVGSVVPAVLPGDLHYEVGSSAGDTLSLPLDARWHNRIHNFCGQWRHQ